MLPDIAIRINNLIKSLEKTIVPAIDPDQSMAREQAALVVSHLNLLAQQWDTAYLYEVRSLENMQALAQQLAHLCRAGEIATPVLEDIDSVTGELTEQLPQTVLAVNRYTISLGQSVDALINAVFKHGSPELKQQLQEAVLDYNACQSARERVWFGATNLDPDPSDLASMDAMLFTDTYKYTPTR
ncbi:MAG: hypothetical protein GYB33_06585 [Gammaproteobacteria bacterium]|nr:hypothetical protein [Gammaproteobacteria bacterium]